MKSLGLLVFFLGAFGILLPAALYFGDEILSKYESPGVERLTLSDWLHEEQQRRPQIEADAAIIFHINDENRKIIDALIEGRRSLRDAADAMRLVGESKPPHLCVKADCPPEQFAEEYFIRKAFRSADYTLTDDPRRNAVMARLQAELDDFLYAQEVQP
jgi:hypothetical protein